MKTTLYSRLCLCALLSSAALGSLMSACGSNQETTDDNDAKESSDKESSDSKASDEDDASNKKSNEDDDDSNQDPKDSKEDDDASKDDNSSSDKDPSEDEDDEDKEDDDDKEDESEDEDEDPMPWFTFFTTSQEGLVELAPDKENGFGGDLGGLEGADEICKKLALRGNPGDKKTWRAFLSAHKGPDGNVVHAIDRIGEGPWHDFNKRLMAKTKKDLLPGQDRRPAGADPQLAEMFTDEMGQPISPDINVVDNHDMLTGSDKNGRLPADSTPAETCNDWTSKRTDLGKPRIGHAWPRSRRSGREWIFDHRAGGCGAGMDTEKKKGNGTPTVGSGGGYGGIYCFALQ